MPDQRAQEPQKTLAEHLNTLLDVVAAESGSRYTFPEIKAAMAERGVHISRQRWHYMRAGTGPMTTDVALLEALADFFGVPVAFLTDPDAEVPTRVAAQLELLRTLKEAEVKNFAARALTSDLSTETLLEIRDIIDQTLNQQSDHGSGTDAAAGLSEGA
jgi:predicted RecB family endonuclease